MNSTPSKSTRMKFGVQHGIGDSRWTPAILSPKAVKRFAVTAEQGGFDAIAFTDHPAPSNRWVESGGEGVADLFTSLGFCAAVTSRVRLLTYVLLPTYRNPFVTAHQAATLDHLSEGRLTLGLGTGYLKSEFHALGVDPNNRRDRFEEALSVCKQVWAGHDVTIEGHGYSARGVRSVPAAYQQPHPPIWLHANTSWATDWVVREGQGWMGMIIGAERTPTLRTTPIPTVEAFLARVDDVRARCEAVGRNPATLEIINNGMWSMLDIRTGLSAEQMRDDVGRLSAHGVDWITFNLCGDDPDVSIETLQWFSDEIIAG
jgi:probable F420-dependent oxidoreductase